ncbi:hypothetical protein [Halanaerobacter jeridensis]|uniref:Uncharacterized protein n=1 Tax=Halanaerobacter jeridensis TaxID=706427 RepID=A0A938XU80_9FIRM|nr:hypothetical protein [Halanaerobacter jeridensis]MBM7557999.1 hypothetical protein [Halanaerobacter jeridensis]
MDGSEEKMKKEVYKRIDRAAKRIHKYGWPISPNIDQLDLMFLGGNDESKYNFLDDQNNELSKEEGIDRFVCDIFKKDDYNLLKDIVNGWQLDPFKKREEIWSQCLKAHINEDYILSTHTLILQIEGLLEDFNEIYSYSNRVGITHFIEDFIEWFSNKANTDLEGISKEIFDSFNKNIDFVSKNTEQVDDESKFYNSLNRHYIAHGYLTNANEVLSLKCFILLDFIHFAFDLFE